jgi:hypothetical protein
MTSNVLLACWTTTLICDCLGRYAIAGLLLWNLNKRVVLLPPQLNDLRFDRFLKSGMETLVKQTACDGVHSFLTSSDLWCA